jgi:hypothetical protein
MKEARGEISTGGFVASVYEEGQQVKHGNYGLGVIVESDEERTSIDFVDHGPKKFVTSMVVLEITDEQPPKGKRRARRSSGRRTKKSPKK